MKCVGTEYWRKRDKNSHYMSHWHSGITVIMRERQHILIILFYLILCLNIVPLMRKNLKRFWKISLFFACFFIFTVSSLHLR